MIIPIFASLILLFLYVFVIKPLCPMIKLKMQFGQDCNMQYNFFGRDIWKRLRDMKIFNDIFWSDKEEYKKQPYKFKVSNSFWKIQIQVADPEYYKQMLHNPHYYEKANNIADKHLLQKGLIFETRDQWKAQRRILADQFQYQQLTSRLPMINKIILDGITKIGSQNNLFEQLELITGKVVIQSFFGDSMDGLKINNKDLQVEVTELINDMGELRFKSKYVFIKRLLLGTWAWNIFPIQEEMKIEQRIFKLKTMIEKVIRKRLIELRQSSTQNDQKSSNIFLDILLNDYIKNDQKKQENQAIDEVIQQFITLLFAGTDSTAVLSYHCLYYLSIHPEFQQEVRDEILSICPEEYIVEDKLKQLSKLSAFINEVLRLKNPAVNLLMRNSTQTHQVKDLTIQKNWRVIINFQFQLLSEKNFKNPNDFDYKRWLSPSPILCNNDFVYLPFSSGQRNCIGQHMALMEAKIILSQILKQYYIEPNKEVNPNWNLRFILQLQPGNCMKLFKMIEKQD